MLLCDFVHVRVSVTSLCASLKMNVCEIDWYPVLSVAWLIDVQSKYCSFACMPLERRVNEASVARSPCFLLQRDGTCNVCAQQSNAFPSLNVQFKVK